MRRETKELLRDREGADPFEAIARGLAHAQDRASQNPPTDATQRTLELTTRLFTMTEAELHDLTYHAVSTYLRTLTAMTKAKAHEHAARIAAESIRQGLASDYIHQGVDPRA